MKILIADDSLENLEYAKKAAAGFPDHDFQFCSSASEALARLPYSDILITDLFFPPEQNEDLRNEYHDYVMRTAASASFEEVVQQYYNGNYDRVDESLKDALAVMQEGTSRVPIERLIKQFETPFLNPLTGRTKEPGQFEKEQAGSLKKLLKELPPPQFPYGGALMLKAKCLDMPCVLVTDLHRHASSFNNHVHSVDGMVILLPLIEEGIITAHEAMFDGSGSNTYMGRDEMHNGSKENAETWNLAISKALKQKQ